jgi:prepilin-type N-terminal cleavage/methylation domain-containing protein
MTTSLRQRSGMTLVEMLIALTVFGLVMAGAFTMLRSQSKGFQLGSDRAATLQNLRYTANTLELDLRTLGSDVPDGQPFLIYAGPTVIAYNADYTTNIANDPYAVYYDPDAPSSAVMALQAAGKITIPLTSVSYPDTSYMAQGSTTLNSPAETIVFFFSPDSSTARSDDYVLYRQVNNATPEVVAHNLLKTSNAAFFTYYRLHVPPNAASYVDTVPAASLPLRHSVKIHGSPADTGAAAVVDSIRGVLVRFTATNGKTGADERTLSISRTIRFPNAGMAVKKTCGDEPIFGSTVTAVATVVSGAPAVTLTWNPAVDETGGEKDVQMYVVWRKLSTDPGWGTPFLSIPAGQPSYTYTDATVVSGSTYQYQVAAQDCTPSLSASSTSAAVAVP